MYRQVSSLLMFVLASLLTAHLLNRSSELNPDTLMISVALMMTLITGYIAIYQLSSAIRRRIPDQPELFPESCPDPVLRLSPEGQILYSNPATSALLKQLELSALSAADRLLPPDLNKKLAVLNMDAREKATWVYPLGNRYLQCTIHSVPEFHYYHVYLTDVTQRKVYEKKLYFQATHDTLTALPNRRMLLAELEHRLLRSTSADDSFALMLISLDRLKVISGSLGYDVGDQLVRKVAQRFDDVVRRNSGIPGNFCLFQLDNADFAVLINRFSNPGALSRLAHLYMKSMDDPLYISSREYFTTISIGISLFPKDGTDAPTLLRNADSARQLAVDQHGSSELFYNTGMSDTDAETLALENHLRHAVERDELEIHYQPQFCLKTRRISGMEAVLRWNHPELGSVMPEKFIPLAEESGIITPISNWMLLEACKQTRLWQRQGLNELQLAINISRRQLHQRTFLSQIDQALSASDLAPAFLELEITETAVLQAFEETRKRLLILRNRGIHLSIDDFGTGWSSFAFLKEFPMDKIKIDQSFVNNLVEDSFNAAICKSVIELGHSQKLTVIAEGVETIDQKNWLTQQGCDQIQGFYFSKPLPADDFRNFVRSANCGNVLSFR